MIRLEQREVKTDARDPVTLKVVGSSLLRDPKKSSQSASGMNPCSYVPRKRNISLRLPLNLNRTDLESDRGRRLTL